MHLLTSFPRWIAPRSCPLAVILVLLFPLVAHGEKPEQLKPQGYVNDFAGVLSKSAKSQLTALCEEVDLKAKAQIAIVTIRSLEGVAPADFAVDLAQRWGVGPKQKDRGVLILLAPNDRKYWVTVGYGLEPILPDGKVGGFGREMVPFLRQGDYSEAVLLITGRIADVIAEDRGIALTRAPSIPSPREAPEALPGIISLVFYIIVFVIFLIAPLLGFFMRLFLGSSGRHRYSRGGGWFLGGPWIGGGSSWGGGGFGGGFGGFGGGGFGGGGAGGSW
jgi:uncharacterized protein